MTRIETNLEHSDSACVKCGDTCTSRYDLHGWLCDECSDPLAAAGTLYTDDELAALGDDY